MFITFDRLPNLRYGHWNLWKRKKINKWRAFSIRQYMYCASEQLCLYRACLLAELKVHTWIKIHRTFTKLRYWQRKTRAFTALFVSSYIFTFRIVPKQAYYEIKYARYIFTCLFATKQITRNSLNLDVLCRIFTGYWNIQDFDLTVAYYNKDPVKTKWRHKLRQPCAQYEDPCSPSPGEERTITHSLCTCLIAQKVRKYTRLLVLFRMNTQ